MFLKKQFKNVKDPLYRAWLHLKFAAAGTETEAIDHLLDSKVAKNVPKRKTVRKDYRPKGPARHDPTSPEWVSVLEEQQQNRKLLQKERCPTILEMKMDKMCSKPRKKSKLQRKRSQTKKISTLSINIDPKIVCCLELSINHMTPIIYGADQHNK